MLYVPGLSHEDVTDFFHLITATKSFQWKTDNVIFIMIGFFSKKGSTPRNSLKSGVE